MSKGVSTARGPDSKNQTGMKVPRKGSSLRTGGSSADSKKAANMARRQSSREKLRGQEI